SCTPWNRSGSFAAASRYRSRRELCRTGPSSQAIPSQRRSSRIASSPPGTLPAGSVSSIRSSIVPPKLRLATAPSALPMCNEPVGLGAKRTLCIDVSLGSETRRLATSACARRRPSAPREAAPVTTSALRPEEAKEPAATIADRRPRRQQLSELGEHAAQEPLGDGDPRGSLSTRPRVDAVAVVVQRHLHARLAQQAVEVLRPRERDRVARTAREQQRRRRAVGGDDLRGGGDAGREGDARLEEAPVLRGRREREEAAERPADDGQPPRVD